MVKFSVQPIGVFDSGLGGLTVVKEIVRQLPGEDVVYFGDTARVPYGTKSKEAVIRFSKQNVTVLLDYDVKLVVVACNTSSSWAMPSLKKAYDVPVLGVIEPGARKAALATRNKKVGVIATPSTVRSAQYTRHIQRCDPSIEVFSQACPLFVPLAEEGWFDHPVTREVARTYLTDLKARGVDTVILGCTHYPLLKDLIQDVMGSGVTLIDSASEIAAAVKDVLQTGKQLNDSKRRGHSRFLVSDEAAHFSRQAERFLGRPVDKVKRVKFS